MMLPNVGFQISVFINFIQFRNYTGFPTDYFDSRNMRFKLIQTNRSDLEHYRRFFIKRTIELIYQSVHISYFTCKKAQREFFPLEH